MQGELSGPHFIKQADFTWFLQSCKEHQPLQSCTPGHQGLDYDFKIVRLFEKWKIHMVECARPAPSTTNKKRLLSNFQCPSKIVLNDLKWSKMGFFLRLLWAGTIWYQTTKSRQKISKIDARGHTPPWRQITTNQNDSDPTLSNSLVYLIRFTPDVKEFAVRFIHHSILGIAYSTLCRPTQCPGLNVLLTNLGGISCLRNQTKSKPWCISLISC